MSKISMKKNTEYFLQCHTNTSMLHHTQKMTTMTLTLFTHSVITTPDRCDRFFRKHESSPIGCFKEKFFRKVIFISVSDITYLWNFNCLTSVNPFMTTSVLILLIVERKTSVCPCDAVQRDKRTNRGDCKKYFPPSQIDTPELYVLIVCKNVVSSQS